jgi:hypothetical protein
MKLQSSSNLVNNTVPCIKSSNSSSVRIVVKHSSQVNGSGVVVPLPTITVLSLLLIQTNLNPLSDFL